MSASAHGARDHAQWSASATARNWTCPGAIAMATLAPPDKESIHAATGTAVHQIAEKCLLGGLDAVAFLGTVEKTKEFGIDIGEEECNSAQMYVDYVRAARAERKADLLTETKFSLAQLNPPYQAGGTCDAILIDEGLIEVVDLKNGQTIVEPKGNPQLRTYALGAMLVSGVVVSKIRSTIVQPRAAHKEGRIRSETFDVSELVEWTSDLMKAMRRSKAATGEFEQIGANRVVFDEWADKYLVPGACSFCPAEGFCPALKRHALRVVPEIAKKWFEEPGSGPMPVISNMPKLQSPEQLGHDLDGLDELESWIKALRGHAHAEAERGTVIPGYQLSERIGNRVFTDDEAALIPKLKSLGLTEDQIYTKKLVSPAQAEKALGVKSKPKIEALCHKPVKGTNLVSTAKTTRPAAKSKTEQFFEPIAMGETDKTESK